jgi:hypothetical protein
MIKVRYKRPNLFAINPVCFTVGIPRATCRETVESSPRDKSRQSATSVVVASGGGLRRRTRRTVYIKLHSFVVRVCFPVVGFGNRIPTSSRERERLTRCIHPAWTDDPRERAKTETHTRREREGAEGAEREREWILIHTVRLCRRIASGVVASGGIRPRTRHTSSMDGWMDGWMPRGSPGWMDGCAQTHHPRGVRGRPTRSHAQM